jgi:hypothetical protein
VGEFVRGGPHDSAAGAVEIHEVVEQLVAEQDRALGLGDQVLAQGASVGSIEVVIEAEAREDAERVGKPLQGAVEGAVELGIVGCAAHFLAGFYLGLRKKESPQVSLWTAGKDIWSSGDTQYNSPDHHGTPQERIAAAEAGFKVSFVEGRSAHDAFRAATDYVLSR